jgi:hypothetical protein
MWKKAVATLGVVASLGCANFTAPDGIQIEGERQRTIAGTCQVAMPDGMMGEKGSEPDLGSCSGIDSRITSGK